MGPLKLGDTGREIFISAILPQSLTAFLPHLEVAIFSRQAIYSYISIKDRLLTKVRSGERPTLKKSYIMLLWKHFLGFLAAKASVYEPFYTLEVSCLAGCDSDLINATQAEAK